ncbi:hypothetical protein SmJEL517_g01825 [Synchytrium microbalum]|uniref:GH26 domain-containing protein n=1 Tax=Synchytrium microbalum TaxID=1806994 RepID=A0A507CCX3_9FUNG|nr:uncharacterized protein SmJEL517_g01825 [Synchytrium microbalum]TPX35896.1 hypothetical protein SmJEL517_g01825 [Synchytrium microbalum]
MDYRIRQLILLFCCFLGNVLVHAGQPTPANGAWWNSKGYDAVSTGPVDTSGNDVNDTAANCPGSPGMLYYMLDDMSVPGVHAGNNTITTLYNGTYHFDGVSSYSPEKKNGLLNVTPRTPGGGEVEFLFGFPMPGIEECGFDATNYTFLLIDVTVPPVSYFSIAFDIFDGTCSSVATTIRTDPIFVPATGRQQTITINLHNLLAGGNTSDPTAISRGEYYTRIRYIYFGKFYFNPKSGAYSPTHPGYDPHFFRFTKIRFDACAYRTPSRKRVVLEPPNSAILFGVHISYSSNYLQPYKQQPNEWNAAFQSAAKKLGASKTLQNFGPTVFWFFVSLNGDFSGAKWTIYNYMGGVRSLGAVMGITISSGGYGISDAVYNDIGYTCADVNKRGVPLMLRWQPEFNANWMSYGQQPTAFNQSWIKLWTALQTYGATSTALVWAPNTIGPDSSPFGWPSSYNDKQLMDTNKDGNIDAKDTWTPFWPGAKYVDWIGNSLYFKRNQYWSDANDAPDWVYKFVDTATGNGTENSDLSFYNIYDFAVQQGKPYALAEGAAEYHWGGYTDSNNPPYPGSTSAGIPRKQGWWKQLYMSKETRLWMPNLKMVAHFEYFKFESGEWQDWRHTADGATLNALVQDMNDTSIPVGYILGPNQFTI